MSSRINFDIAYHLLSWCTDVHTLHSLARTCRTFYSVLSSARTSLYATFSKRRFPPLALEWLELKRRGVLSDFARKKIRDSVIKPVFNADVNEAFSDVPGTIGAAELKSLNQVDNHIAFVCGVRLFYGRITVEGTPLRHLPAEMDEVFFQWLRENINGRENIQGNTFLERALEIELGGVLEKAMSLKEGAYLSLCLLQYYHKLSSPIKNQDHVYDFTRHLSLSYKEWTSLYNFHWFFGGLPRFLIRYELVHYEVVPYELYGVKLAPYRAWAEFMPDEFLTHTSEHGQLIGLFEHVELSIADVLGNAVTKRLLVNVRDLYTRDEFVKACRKAHGDQKAWAFDWETCLFYCKEFPKGCEKLCG